MSHPSGPMGPVVRSGMRPSTVYAVVRRNITGSLKQAKSGNSCLRVFVSQARRGRLAWLIGALGIKLGGNVGAADQMDGDAGGLERLPAVRAAVPGRCTERS